MLPRGEIKINVEKSEEYRDITRMLNEKETEQYSFEDKQNRPLKVIVKRLYPTCKATSTVEDLKQKGYKITRATNIESKTNRPLPIFMLIFDKEEDVKKMK